MIIKKTNKKGLSEILGYLLLVSFAIFMSFIVYEGIKTYVPQKDLECPDGVSVFAYNSTCKKGGDGNYTLDLEIKNNGRYNIAGYFIHATTNETQTIATLNLAPFLIEIYGGIGGVYNINSAIIFELNSQGNFINISEIASANFKGINKKIYSIDILPVRFQKAENNKIRMVSCKNAFVRERINCIE